MATGMAGTHHRGIGADHHHKGTGQAGNKSMLSYKVDTGVPGYTGYIPSSASIPLPVKGSTVHTGRVAGEGAVKRLAANVTKDQLARTMYSADFGSRGVPAPPRKEGGGYWITNATRDGPAKQFISTTTYNAELQESAATAKRCYTASEGIRRTTIPVTATSTMVQSATSEGPVVAEMGTLGYVSTYSNMVVKDPKTGGLVAAGRPQTEPGSTKVAHREKVLKSTQTPVFYGETLYMKNFGTYGSNPLSRSAPGAHALTSTASTAEFNEGTTRATSQIPGYSGFIPASGQNEAARTHAKLAAGRPSAKDSMLLSALDQYSRNLLPRYCGFRPQAPENIKPSQPPTTLTTQGSSNMQVCSAPTKVVDNANFHKGDEGTMSFFTAGQVSVSDNGKSVAERYFHTVRPREGLPRILVPSKTTASGYKFPR